MSMLLLLRNIILGIIVASNILIAQDTTVIPLNLNAKNLPFGLSYKCSSHEFNIGLALSGGGARGFAHIGFLQALEENNIPIDYIVGTSIGSIIGGLYASGYTTEQLEKILFETNWNQFLSSKELSRSDLFVDQKITEDRAIFALRIDGLKPVLPTSINSGQSILNFLNTVVINAPIHTDNFDNLLYKFRAVTTNLITGSSVVNNSGSLSKVMRASSSISFLLPPVKIDSLILVDGGLTANIPAEITRKLGSDVVLAFNTVSPLNTSNELKLPWNVADQTLSIPMHALNLINFKFADMVLQPDLGNRLNTDFSKLDSLVKIGYELTQKRIPEIKEIIKQNFFRRLKSDYPVNIKNISLSDGLNPIELSVRERNGSDLIDLYNLMYLIHQEMQSGSYESAAINLISDSTGIRCEINFTEPEVLKEIELNGFSVFNEEMIRPQFEDLIGKPLNQKLIFKRLITVINDYREIGYSLAEFKNIKFENNKLTINLQEGIISQIEIRGNTNTNLPVIEREIKMEKGRLFQLEQFEQTLTNLQSTDLFQTIDVYVKELGDGEKIIFDFTEKNPRIMRFGLRLDNENFLQLSLDIRDENLFGTGSELGAIFSSGVRNRSGIIEHKANQLFNTYFNYKLQLYSKFNDFYEYTDDTTYASRKFGRRAIGEYRQVFSGVSFGIGTQVKKFGKFLLEFRHEHNEVKNKDNYTGEVYKQNVNAIKLGLLVDSQDRYPLPKSGFLVQSFFETAQKSYGGDVGYTKFFFDYKSYFTFAEKHTISPSFVIGFADATLPLAQQFSIGGHHSFFGFRNDYYRGRQILKSSLEYITKLPFKIFFDSYFKFRYDIGSVWKQKEAIRFKDLKHGIGTSITIDTPLGQADFSVGRSFLLTESSSGVTKIKLGEPFIYFTIGYYY